MSCLRQPNACPYHKIHPCSPQPPILFFKISFNIILPYLLRSFTLPFSFSFPLSKPVCILVGHKRRQIFDRTDNYQLSYDFHITISSVSVEEYAILQWRDVEAVGGGCYFSSHGKKIVCFDEWNKNWPSWKQKTNTRNIFKVHRSGHLNNILIYTQEDAMLHILFYLETALHVSGGTTTHHHSAYNCIYSIWYLSHR